MKGGTYQVITEDGRPKRFSNSNDNTAESIVHNNNGQADVMILKSLFPGKTDNEIIDTIGPDTYTWLRNLSVDHPIHYEETPIEEQFRSLSNEQQNHVIDATKGAITARLTDKKFDYEWIPSDSVEYRKKIESGIKPHDIQRWKLKPGHFHRGDASGHKTAIYQLRKTLDNFKSIQYDIVAEQERQKAEEEKQEREQMLQASQAAAAVAEKHRLGMQNFSREIESNFKAPLSNILDYQKELEGLGKKEKVKKAELKIKIHTEKMKVKDYHDHLKYDGVKHNLTLMERNKVFDENTKDLSFEHQELHTKIIETKPKEFLGMAKSLKKNLTDLTRETEKKASAAKTAEEEASAYGTEVKSSAETLPPAVKDGIKTPKKKKGRKRTIEQFQAERKEREEREERDRERKKRDANKEEALKIYNKLPGKEVFEAAMKELNQETKHKELTTAAGGIFFEAFDKRGRGIRETDLDELKQIQKESWEYMEKARILKAYLLEAEKDATLTAHLKKLRKEHEEAGKGGKTRRKKRYKTKTKKHKKKKSKTKRARKHQKKRKTKCRS